MSRSRRFVALLTGSLVLTVVPIGQQAAQAATVTFNSGELDVTGDATNETITITCAAGFVNVNAAPTIVTCASPTSLVVNGGGGNDTIDAAGVAGAAFTNLTSVTLNGGSSGDQITGSQLNDAINGGAGGDIMEGNGGNDTIKGGTDKYPDELYEATNAALVLTNASMTGIGTDNVNSIERAHLVGGVGANVFDASGFSGPVTLEGLGNDDTLTAGGDSGYLVGGPGNDTLNGGPHDDNIRGDDGNDALNGAGGNDSFQPDSTGVAGTDSVSGGTGKDTLSYSGVQSGIVTDTSATILGPDTLSGLERLYVNVMNPAGVTLNASAFSGSETLVGDSGVDILSGGAADDLINGHGANDILQGNGGTDKVSVYANAAPTASISDTAATGEGSDTLSGFERGVIFGDSAVQTLTVSSFTGSVDVYTGGGSDTVNGNGAKTFVGADDSGAIDVTDALIDGPTYNVTLNNVGAVQVGGSDLADHIDARTFHGPVTLLGQDGNDTLLGGPKADEINGLDGNDVVRGYRGNDIVRGGLGKDAIDGGKGTDACDGTKSDKSVQNCEKKAPPIKK